MHLSPKELLALAKDRGYTPGAQALKDAWVALDCVDKKEAKLLERLLLRALRSHPHEIHRISSELAQDGAWSDYRHPERYLRVWARALGELKVESKGPEGTKVALNGVLNVVLPEALSDSRLPLKRQAVIWVGKYQLHDLFDQYVVAMLNERDSGPLYETALESAALCSAQSSLARELLARDIDTRRSAKGGSFRTRAQTPQETPEPDQRKRARIQLIAEREQYRAEHAGDGELSGAVALEDAFLRAELLPNLDIDLRCRDGLQPWLREELDVLPHTELQEIRGGLRFELARAHPIQDLASLRCALDWGFSVPATEVEEFLSHPQLRAQIEALFETRPIPFRVHLDTSGAGQGGRAATWDMAKKASQSWDALINEPVQAALELICRPPGSDGPRFCLRLRRRADPRFAYRKRDIPAASHPTIAAALARAAQVQPGEVVWDPFAGSGLELIEALRLQSQARGLGSDIDAAAIAAAQENAAAAGVELDLFCQDARQTPLPEIHKVISNPPHGRRVSRDEVLEELHGQVLHHALDHLVPGGELHWLSPRPEAMKRIAIRRGCAVYDGHRIDLSGIYAQYQCIVKKKPRPRTRRPR